MNFTIQNIIGEKKKELESAFHAINQSRSDFQIANFVVGTHDTPERQFVQCILELQTKTFNLRRQIVEERKIKKKILEAWDEDERELLSISLEEMAFSFENQIREWNTLYQIFQSMPKFTHEQIQAGEAAYWELRLARQAQEDIMANGRISVSNLDALWQAKQLDHPGIQFIEQHQQKKDLLQ